MTRTAAHCHPNDTSASAAAGRTNNSPALVPPTTASPRPCSPARWCRATRQSRPRRSPVTGSSAAHPQALQHQKQNRSKKNSQKSQCRHLTRHSLLRSVTREHPPISHLHCQRVRDRRTAMARRTLQAAPIATTRSSPGNQDTKHDRTTQHNNTITGQQTDNDDVQAARIRMLSCRQGETDTHLQQNTGVAPDARPQLVQLQ